MPVTTKLTEHKGTGVRVYGTNGNFTLLPCNYSIDGVARGVYNVKSYPSTQYQTQFFQLQGLTAGSHSLLITTTTLESDPPGGTFTLDYFAVTPLPIATTSSLPSSSYTSNSLPSSPFTSNPTTGEIIGGVIGGLALLIFSAAFIAFLLFWWKRNHWQRPGQARRSLDYVGVETL